MKKKNKLILTVSLTISAIAVCTTAGVISYANYQAAEMITQQIGYSGRLEQKSIFFNADIWEASNPTIYMYKSDNGSTNWEFVSESRTITPTINTGTDVQFKMHIFTLEKPVSGTTKFKFYRIDPKRCSSTASDNFVIKKFNSPATDFPLYVDPADSNHYIAKHVSLSVGDKFKGYGASPESWYSNDTAPTGCSMESGANSNIVVSTAGTYTIDLYLRADNNNHIVMTNESSIANFAWNDTQDITYNSSTNYYCITNWNGDNGKSGYSTNNLYADNNGVLHFDH